jgi:hypothetical protein
VETYARVLCVFLWAKERPEEAPLAVEKTREEWSVGQDKVDINEVFD